MLFSALLTVASLASVWASRSEGEDNCDTLRHGYVCNPAISHSWGQYSPYYSVPSELHLDVPAHCEISFAQVLSRHGARDPTASKTKTYSALISGLKSRVTSFAGKYAFLSDYQYTLGADQLTEFGQNQLFHSGVQFYKRYKSLARESVPFIRAASEDRVVESAQNWTQGFHSALEEDGAKKSKDEYPYDIVVISEADGSNNTLSHGLCTAFEEGPVSEIGDDAQKIWRNIFTAPILTRLNTDLPGANFSNSDVISFMDLCPFNTVASPVGDISAFCNLFTEQEWKGYDYYQSLGKYYGYGSGNPLGPTQGVGFVNELIARLTHSAVKDSTSSNHTLDSNSATFPIDKEHVLFADFSHDNDMTAIFAALGLYNATAPLSNTTIQSTSQTQGYSASWTVPFAARVYFEKIKCIGEREEFVRVIVNDRVLPLPTCNSDRTGKCRLDSFIKSLSFARTGGKWGECFS